MDGNDTDTPRDDRAWPRWAVPVSFLVGLAALAFGIVVSAQDARPYAIALLLAGLVSGASLLIFGIRRWLRGQPFPSVLGIVAIVLAIAAAQLGRPLLAGLVAGCFLANVWAVYAARKNRTVKRQ